MNVTNRQRLEFAAAGFLAEMRKQWAILHPQDSCPVKSLSDYPPNERSALMAAVQKAIQFAGPDTDVAFAAWLAKREEEAAHVT
jgi:diadenosine tetraphosphate (Ap4A) HIT family hydrolase